MPVSKANPPQVPPSSVSIGKKPMNYSQSTAAAAQAAQQPKSARAAAKAPAYNIGGQQQQQPNRQTSPPTSNASAGNKGRAGVGGGATQANGPTAAQKGKANANKIWSTSTTEERERIKEFWLGLGEQERRNLVKIEKDTVLRKMKEQQKHSCSCAVCGRKRNAIEEELEVLYDAYYEELEQYANYQQRYLNSGGAIPPPPGPGPFPGSVELDKNGAVVSHAAAGKRGARPKQPPQQRVAQQNGRKTQRQIRPHPQHHPPGKDELEDDGEEEEEYEGEEYEEEEEDEEDELDEEDEEEEEDEDDISSRPPANGRVAKPPPQPAAARRNPPGRGVVRDGMFNISNSLTVTGPGNILTVADDLLKNDGQKFLEMMEQLAERRLQREEEAAADVEEESDEESDEERDGSEGEDDADDDGVSEDDDEDEEDDDDEEIMTEEQKMEEGKRMFSIFAARLFEQRVLQAYREKVAQERQLQLLRELDEEDKSSRDREAKKQSQNQKKKDKKKQQKMVKEEEKATKEAERLAEEAKIKARQAALDEESKRKREEERIRREASKKAAEEEKARKEEEKKKRQQEERDREMDRERKKREKEERTRKEKEEKDKKAKEERARIVKEREEKAEKDRLEKKEREEKEKVEREERLKKEREEKAERDAKEKAKQAAQRERAAAAAAAQSATKTPVRNNAAASASSSSLTTPVKSAAAHPATPPALHRTPNTSTGSVVNGIAGSKKSKQAPPVTPTAPSNAGSSRSQQGHPLPQPLNLPRPSHLPPAPLNPQQFNPHLPPQQMYGHPSGPVMIPPALSPRVGTFPSMQYPFNTPTMPQHPPPGTPMTASSIPQGFNGQPFDPSASFNRGMPMASMGVPLTRGGSGGLPPLGSAPAPIGPPKAKTPLAGTSAAPGGPTMLAPGAGRRASTILNNGSPHPDSSPVGLSSPAPGPIGRPIGPMAPIARPTTNTADNATTSSGSGSPTRRSPSPKGVLGSSALAADDDEVVPTGGARRVGNTAPIGIGLGIPIGTSLQSWGPASPRTALSPWNSTPTTSGGPNAFISPSPARAMPASASMGGNGHAPPLHLPPGHGGSGVPAPIGSAMWKNSSNGPATGANDPWHPQNSGFFHGQFMTPQTPASSTPHTAS